MEFTVGFVGSSNSRQSKNNSGGFCEESALFESCEVSTHEIKEYEIHVRACFPIRCV